MRSGILKPRPLPNNWPDRSHRAAFEPAEAARETSEPLAKRWQRPVPIEPAVAEIPSPSGLGLAERAEWLRGFMGGSWRDASRELAQWREEAIVALAAIKDDTVIFTHFILINVRPGRPKATIASSSFARTIARSLFSTSKRPNSRWSSAAGKPKPG